MKIREEVYIKIVPIIYCQIKVNYELKIHVNFISKTEEKLHNIVSIVNILFAFYNILLLFFPKSM